jgi:hypothetical protein
MLTENEFKFLVAAKRSLEGEPMTEAQKRMVAYGYTSAVCGQNYGTEVVHVKLDEYARTRRCFEWDYEGLWAGKLTAPSGPARSSEHRRFSRSPPTPSD